MQPDSALPAGELQLKAETGSLSVSAGQADSRGRSVAKLL